MEESIKIITEEIKSGISSVTTLSDNLSEYLESKSVSNIKSKIEHQKSILEKLENKNETIINNLKDELTQHKSLSTEIENLGQQLFELHHEVDRDHQDGLRYQDLSKFKTECFVAVDNSANKIPQLEETLTKISGELRSNIFSSELKTQCTKLRRECAAITALVMAKRGKFESALIMWENFEKDLNKIQNLINSCEEVSSLVNKKEAYTNEQNENRNTTLERKFTSLISKVQDCKNNMERMKNIPNKLAELTDDVIDSDILDNRLSQLLLLIDELPDELASKLAILHHSKNGQSQLKNVLEDLTLWLNAFQREEENMTNNISIYPQNHLDKDLKQISRLKKMLNGVEQRILCAQSSEFLTDNLIEKLDTVKTNFTVYSDVGNIR